MFNFAAARIACFESEISSRAIFIYDTATDQFAPYVQASYAAPGGASLNRDGTLLGTQIDTPTSHTVATDSVPELNFVFAFNNGDGDVVFDAVQDLVYAVNSSTDQIIAYNTQTRLEQFRLNIGEDVDPGSRQFDTGTLVASQNGRYLALATASGIRLLSVPQSLPSPSPTPTPSLANRTGMVFDHSGNYLYVATLTGFVMRYNLTTDTVDATYYVGGSLRGLDIAPDDSFLVAAQDYVGVAQAVLEKVDLSTGLVSHLGYVREFDEAGGWATAITSNDTVFVTSQCSCAGFFYLKQIDLVTNASSWRYVPGFGHYAATSENTEMTRSADYSRVYFLEPNEYRGPVYTYNARTDSFEGAVLTDRDDLLKDLAVNRDGSLLATRFGTITAMDKASDLTLQHVYCCSDGGIAFDGASDTIYILDNADKLVLAYDTNNFHKLFQVDIGEQIGPGSREFGPGRMIASPDGRHVAIEAGIGIKVITLPLAPFPTPTPPSTIPNPRGMVFDRAGQYLYIATDAGMVYPYQISTGQLLAPYDVGGLPNTIDIAADDSFLIVAQDGAGLTEGMLHKIDLVGGTVTDIKYDLQTLEAGVWDVAIAANGLALFSADRGGNGSLVHQIDFATNLVTARTDAPSLYGRQYPLRQTKIRRSPDRTHLYFLEPEVPSGPVYTYTSELDSFSAPFQTSLNFAGDSVAISRDASLLAIGGSLYATATFSSLHSFSLLDSGVAFDQVKDRFYGVSTFTAQVIAYNSKNYSENFRIEIGESIPSGKTDFGPGTLVASQNGQYLALTTPTAVRVYDVTAVPTPTPLPTVETPVISPSGGTFTKKVTVKLSCATAGATIYYTLDGSDPTTGSSVYIAGKKNKGFKLTGIGTHTVKALGAESGYNNSAIASATFTIN